MVKSEEKDTSPDESVDSNDDGRRVGRTTGRVKKPKAIFDPSEAPTPKTIAPPKTTAAKTTAKVVQLGAKTQQSGAAVANRRPNPLRIQVLQRKSVQGAQTAPKVPTKSDTQAAAKTSAIKTEPTATFTKPSTAPVASEGKKSVESAGSTEAVQTTKSKESIGALLSKSIASTEQRTTTTVKLAPAKPTTVGTTANSAQIKPLVLMEDVKLPTTAKLITAAGTITSTTKKLDNSPTAAVSSGAQKLVTTPRVKSVGILLQPNATSIHPSSIVLQSGPLQRIQSSHVALNVAGGKPVLTSSLVSPRIAVSASGGTQLKLVASPPVRHVGKQVTSISGACNIQQKAAAAATSPPLEVSSVRQAVKRAANSTQDEPPRKMTTIVKAAGSYDIDQSDRDFLMSFLPYMKRYTLDEKLRMRQQIMRIFIESSASASSAVKLKSETQGDSKA